MLSDQACRATHPPQNVSELLKSMWYEAKNDWEAAHRKPVPRVTLEEEWKEITGALLKMSH